MSDGTRPRFQLRLSTLLLLVMSAGLIAFLFANHFAYQSKVRVLRQVIEAEINDLEADFEDLYPQLGPGHRDCKALTDRAARLKDALKEIDK